MSIKKWLFKDAEPASKKEVKQDIPKPIGINGSHVPGISAQPIAGGTDYNQHLDKVMEKFNQPGPDFYEFHKSLKLMEGQPLTDQQKYMLTFNSFSVQGVTPSKLINSANAYQDKLTEEKTEFESELEKSKQVGIFAKQEEVRRLEGDIVELTKQIQQKTDTIRVKNGEIDDCIRTLNAEDANFHYAYDNRINLIKQQIQNIQTYLNANITK